MRFKIKNEFFPLKIVLAIASLLFFFSIITLGMFRGNMVLWRISIYTCISIAALIVITLILFFIDKLIGAVIYVDDTNVVIRQLFFKRKIALEDIEEIEFKDYSRRVKRKKEYRLKMTLRCRDGRKISLTDNASRISGLFSFVFGEREELPYAEIPLYQAGKYIEEVTES